MFSQAIRLCLKLCIGQLSKQQKNGPYLSETGAESTVKCALCTKAVCQTNPHKKNNLLFTGKLSLKFLTLEKKSVFYIRNINSSCQLQGAVPKVMTATLNVVVSINSTTVMQTYWTASYSFKVIVL